MLPIAQAYVHVHSKRISSDQLVELSDSVYHIALESAHRFFPFDVEITVSVEEGSLKQKITFAAAASVLVFYGSIRQSIDYAIRDGRFATGWINQQLTSRTGPRREDQIKVMRRTLVAGQLDRLFRKVEDGSLSPEAATEAALAILATSESQDTVRVLTTPLYHEFEATNTGLQPIYNRETLTLYLTNDALDPVGRRLIDGQEELIFPDLRSRVLLPARSGIPASRIPGEDQGVLLYKPLGTERREKLLVRVRQPRG
jgi:hypothetical protein